MAISSPEQVIYNIQLYESDLCCPVCFDEFEEPKALPECLHNVCKNCLQEMFTRNAQEFVECPICREKSWLPLGGVERLLTHHFMQRLVDSISGRKEKLALKSLLKDSENQIEKFKEMILETKELNNNALKKAKEASHAKELKNEISDHAKEVIEIIPDNKRKLTLEVDEIFEEIYRIPEFKDHEEKLSYLLDETVATSLYASDILKLKDTQEIIEQAPWITTQFQEIAFCVQHLEDDLPKLEVPIPRLVKFESANLSTEENILGKLLKDGEDLLNQELLTKEVAVLDVRESNIQCNNCRKLERKRKERARYLRRKTKSKQKAEFRMELRETSGETFN